MRFLPLNHNSKNKNIIFKWKVPDANDLLASKRFANCALNGLWKNLSNSIKNKHPDLIQNIKGVEYIPDDTPLRKIISSLKCFFGMPLDIVDSIVKNFPNSRLNNAEFLQKYRDSVQTKENIRAFQGLQKTVLNFQ